MSAALNAEEKLLPGCRESADVMRGEALTDLLLFCLEKMEKRVFAGVVYA